MFDKIIGTKRTIQRSLVISFLIAILLAILVTLVEFFFFVEPSIRNKFIELHNNGDINGLISIVRRHLYFAVDNIILISILLIVINVKKMLQPIKQLNDATKRVTNGDYDIIIETRRKDEIGELIENFNKMTKGLQSTENLQKEFINNVSHEIKTPISSIEGFAKFLKDKDLPDEEREEYVNIIIEEAERLSNLTGKMLKLSKLHNQDRIVNQKEIMLAEQIRRTISVLEPKWAEKNIKINVKLEEKVFLGDEDLIFQVWLNIIENAIKFSKDGGKIDIKLVEDNQRLIVTVRDYGIGMSNDELEKVFERFYQIDKSHSEEGCGLGLAIVKRIVELSEGEIKINSTQNKGTEVVVKLPVPNKKDNKVYID